MVQFEKCWNIHIFRFDLRISSAISKLLRIDYWRNRPIDEKTSSQSEIAIQESAMQIDSISYFSQKVNLSIENSNFMTTLITFLSLAICSLFKHTAKVFSILILIQVLAGMMTLAFVVLQIDLVGSHFSERNNQ